MLRPDAPKFDPQKHGKMFQEIVELAKRKKKLKEETGYCSKLPERLTAEYLREEDEQ